VDVTTRAVNVDALKECSAYKIIDTVKASTISRDGTSPKVMKRKFSL